MHSEVLNWDRRAHLPTPGAPSIATRYESDGMFCVDERASSGVFMGLAGGIKLLLLDRRRLNESPLFTMPKRIILMNLLLMKLFRKASA